MVPPNKLKRCLLIGKCEQNCEFEHEWGFVVFNSQINHKVHRTERLRVSQVAFAPTASREYIDRVCYADCSKIWPVAENLIRREMEENDACYLGQMNTDDLNLVISALTADPRIKPIQRMKYGIV